MAHTPCPNGHDMWNGDGKAVIWAFRVNFIKEYQEKHPDCILGVEENAITGELAYQIYDCTYEIPGEDLDCWICHECNGVVVFVDHKRYDFIWTQDISEVKLSDVDYWEEYIALSDYDFEKFQEFYDGKRPYDAIQSYEFRYKFRLSPDKKTIYAFDLDGDCCFAYKRKCYCEFSPNTEVHFVDESIAPYKPYEWAIGQFDLNVQVGMYAHLKDGRSVLIDEIISPGKRYKGRDIKQSMLPIVNVKHEDIDTITDTIKEVEA